MNRREYLLTCLMEEANEVAKAASKAIRFGIMEVYPNTNETNIDRLSRELNDLRAVTEMVESDVMTEDPFFLSKAMDKDHRAQKKVKMEHYMEYSQALGVLEK